MMKKALIALIWIALIAVVPAAATSSGPSDSPKAQHVMRFRLHANEDRHFDQRHYVGSDILKRDGRFVGYDSYSGYLHPGVKHVFRFALALKHGMIFGRVVAQASHPHHPIEAPIIAGSGRFAGIEGTAEIKFTTPQTLILRYRL
jgi:hypothetical protein